MRGCAFLILRDLRRIALLLLGVILVDTLSLLAVRSGMIHPEWVVWIGRLIMLAIGADVVLGDPAAGSRAQWRTRPVSGRAMAVGKTAVLAIVAAGVGVAVVAGQSLSGLDVWPGIRLGLWEAFGAALWVMLGAALAVLVDAPRGFLMQAAVALIAAASAVAGALFFARYSEFVAWLVASGAKDHGRAVVTAGCLSMCFAFAAVARRYMSPYRIWLARVLAWLACLFVLTHEGLRLLVP